MAMKPKKKDPIESMMTDPKRGAGDPNYIKKMLKSGPKKPTISANVLAGRKPKPAPKSTYVSPNKMAGRKPRNGM